MTARLQAQLSLFAPPLVGAEDAGERLRQSDAALGRLPGGVLKWIGNKQRFAEEIAAALPREGRRYIEPFVGSAAVTATVAPRVGVAADVLAPLVGIHATVQARPEALVEAYAQRRAQFLAGDRDAVYRAVRDRYNADPNPDDLLFLARTCYGGVIRFRLGGAMNTPCGPHRPIPPESLAVRVAAFRARLAGTTFVVSDFAPMMDDAGPGDVVYCDPPYSDSEGTLYGAQHFRLERLLDAIARAKARGARVALSIDGSKRSGAKVIDLALPEGLFASAAMIRVGRSMLRRFQLGGQTLEGEVVADRLLRTWA